MATATITPDQDVVLAEIFIAAPPERVFRAITNVDEMLCWWGQSATYRVTECKADLRPGGKWSSVGVRSDGTTFRVEGEYLEVDPPRLVVYTWIASWSGTLQTTVRFELISQPVHNLRSRGPQKIGTGTLVKIHHSGFAGHAKAADDHRQGWIRVLGWMQAFVEKGETVDTRAQTI